MANVDYDITKFRMDEYGNLIPKVPLGFDAVKKSVKETENEADASKEVGR